DYEVREELPLEEESWRRGGPLVPTILANPASRASPAGGAHSGVSYSLALHFLGLSGLPSGGWLQKDPEYEFIIQAGDGAKRLRPRVPAPPVAEGQGGVDEAELRELLPSANVSSVLRLE
ncbi:unnamed protein product, partial [Polarella glacialis]